MGQDSSRAISPSRRTDRAGLLSFHPKTFDKWARTGLTPAYQLGRRKFRASELDRWLLEIYIFERSQPCPRGSLRKIMRHSREWYQKGSLRRVTRKSGWPVWEFRFRGGSLPGSPMKQKTISTITYPTKAKVLEALAPLQLRINWTGKYTEHQEPNFGMWSRS